MWETWPNKFYCWCYVYRLSDTIYSSSYFSRLNPIHKKKKIDFIFASYIFIENWLWYLCVDSKVWKHNRNRIQFIAIKVEFVQFFITLSVYSGQNDYMSVRFHCSALHDELLYTLIALEFTVWTSTVALLKLMYFEIVKY